MGHWWSSRGFAADQYRKFCLLTVPCKWNYTSSLIRSLFGRSGFSVNILTNWRQNCKRISLSQLLKACTTCNLYGWRLRSLCWMHRALLSDMRNAWACLRADPSDCSWQKPSLGQSCQVCELRTADQVAFYMWQSLLRTTALPIDGLHLEMGLPVDSVQGEIRAESLQLTPSEYTIPQHTHILLLPIAPCWLNLKVNAYVQIPALCDTLAEKHVTKILKCFTISAAPCNTSTFNIWSCHIVFTYLNILIICIIIH